jgi:DNA (cytosine-5)-methyltransferase 1
VIRFAEALNPRWIVIENVINMRRWRRYEELLSKLKGLGYNFKDQILDASDFGVPQSRRRLFILCDRESVPPLVLSRSTNRKTARDIIDWDGPHLFSPLYHPRRAPRTIERAERAIKAIGKSMPFLMVYYGTDGSGGWQLLDRPLRTITTLDRFALVRPGNRGLEMRMLQVPELKAAMGMPKIFVAGHGTRRDQIRAIGNGVCPPVMRAVIRALTYRRDINKLSFSARPSIP